MIQEEWSLSKCFESPQFSTYWINSFWSLQFWLLESWIVIEFPKDFIKSSQKNLAENIILLLFEVKCETKF